MNDKEWKAQRRVLLTEIMRLKAERVNISVRMDEKGVLSNDLKRVKGAVQETDNWFERLGKRITSTRVSIGPFSASLRTLTVAVSTLAPLIIDLGGGVVALGSSFAEAAAGGMAVGAAGMAGFALAAGGALAAIKPVITDMKTASTAATALRTAQLKYGKSSSEAKDAQKALNNVLAGMPPQAQKAVRAWSALKSEFASRTQGIRSDFFGVITDGIKTAKQLLPTFARDATAAFHMASQGAHEWLAGLRTPEAQHILDNIMKNFTQALPAVLHGLGQFATAFGRITSVASDFLPQFTRGFNQVATDFAHSTENGQKLHSTIADLVSQTHSWFGLLGATGRLLTTVLTGGASAGQSMVTKFTATLNGWNRQLQTFSGQRNLQNFFSDAATTTEQFAGVLQRAITLLFSISRITQPLAVGVLQIANAVGDVVQAFQGLTGARAVLAGIGAAIATSFLVGKVVAFVQVIRTLPAAIKAVGTSAAVAEAEINPFVGLLSLVAGGLVALNVASGSGKGPMDAFTLAMARQKQEADQLNTALHQQKQALDDLRGADLGTKRAHLDVLEAQNALTAATHAANRAVNKYGKDSPQARQALLAQRDATLSLKEARHAETEATKTESQAQQHATKVTVEGVRSAVKRVDTLTAERATIKGQIADTRNYISYAGKDEVATSKLREEHQNLATVNHKLNDAQTGVKKAFDATDKTQHALITSTANLNDKEAKAFSEANKGTQIINGLINKLNSQKQAQDHTGGSADGLRSQMRNLGHTLGGVGNVSHGMGSMIGEVTNKILNSFGAKQLHFSLPAVSSLVGGIFQTGGMVGEQRKAAGGFTVPGAGDGDRFRTALPPGSFVMNRRATSAFGLQEGGLAPVALEAGERVFTPPQVKAIGGDILRSMNSAVPRFAKGGGLAGPSQFAFPFDKGHYSWGRTDMGVDFTGTGAIRAMGAGRVIGVGAPGWPEGGGVQYTLDSAIPGLQSRSIYVNEGVAAQVSPGQRISAGQQIATFRGSSIELGQATSSGAALAAPTYHEGDVTAEGLAMRAVLQKLESGSLVAPHIPRIHVKGPAGPLRDALQGQADHLVRTANAYIKKMMPKATGGGAMGALKGGRTVTGSWFNSGDGSIRGGSGMPYGDSGFAELGWSGGPETAATGLGGLPYGAKVRVGHKDRSFIGTKVDVGAGGAGLDGTVRAIDIGSGLARNIGLPVPFGLELVQVDPLARGGEAGLQDGGMVEGGSHHHPHHHNRPPPSQHLRLPPQPHGSPRRDFSTSPGSWYDWYNRAIDFYDTRGDTRETAGEVQPAKSAWQQALTEVVDEEKQVRRIIKHDHKRIRGLEHQKQPKHLRKSKPKPFHFRNRNKGEKGKDYHKAKHEAHKAWKQRMHDWKKQREQWQKSLKQREKSIRGELPDLYQQLRVDLPTRYHDIESKIKGQAADIGLEQTASGQERYQALLAYGGNFSGLGFSVSSGASRFGPAAIPGTSGAPRVAPPAPGARAGLTMTTPPPPKSGLGLQAPSISGSRRAAPTGGGGATHVDNSKVINLHNHYEREPKDPHTWSATMRHEIGAMA
jgi:hypothetical protein